MFASPKKFSSRILTFFLLLLSLQYGLYTLCLGYCFISEANNSLFLSARLDLGFVVKIPRSRLVFAGQIAVVICLSNVNSDACMLSTFFVP